LVELNLMVTKLTTSNIQCSYL